MSTLSKFEKYLAAVCLFLLIGLWIYAASSKLLAFHTFQHQVGKQHLPHVLTRVLPYGLPPVEIVCALLLIIPQMRLAGYMLSAALMLLFTAYVGLALWGAFGQVPCSCGGVISALGWRLHFVFNLFFLLLSTIGIYLQRKEVKDNT